jgi:hypothetical protein
MKNNEKHPLKYLIERGFIAQGHKENPYSYVSTQIQGRRENEH